MSQFDMAYNAGGFWWMLLYYPVIFGNFLLCMKIFEYGIENGWGEDLTLLFSIGASFLCFVIMPCIWIIDQTISKTVVN